MAITATDRIRILVADDDPIIRQLYQSKLVSMGCDVLIAEDGAQAWQHLSSKVHIDLAIVDLEMPNVDGFALIQCVRGHPRTRHLPITVVTSRTDQTAIKSALGAGATSFLTKPLQWSTFSSHIEYLMRLTHSAQKARAEAQNAKATLRIKDLVLGRTNTACNDAARSIQDVSAALMEALQNGANGDAVYEQVASIQQYADAIESILGEAQDAVHSLCAKVNSDDRRTKLDDLISGVILRFHGRAQHRQISINIAPLPERVEIACDEQGLACALGHLLDNAIQYSPERSAVSIEAAVHADGMLTIAIIDDGVGMEPDYYAAILTPADMQEADAPLHTSGIGLPIAKAIAEAHGGTLEVRSMPNSGTSATLVIPADRVDIECPIAEAC